MKSYLSVRERPRPQAVAKPLFLSILIGLFSSPAWAADMIIDNDAHEILLKMSDQLKALQKFGVDYDVDQEVVNLDGQKLQYSASGTISVSRHEGFRMTRNGPYARTVTTFDGKVLTIYGEGLNVYGQIESPTSSLDSAIEEFRASTGFDAVGADLLASDPYSVLTDGVISGEVVGIGYVNGVECDHLAFRTDIADWQVWVTKGKQNLPMKYVITTKWVTGAPQYTLRLRNWVENKADVSAFSFTPPPKAKKLDSISFDEIGDLVLEKDQ